MDADGWVIPEELEGLIAARAWPGDAEAARGQELRPWVAVERVRAFAPEESVIVLHAPPFWTVRRRVQGGERWWASAQAAPGEISFDHTVVIGDFGLGSDAPIVLDYRQDPRRPAVLRLRWGRVAGEGNHWVGVAGTFGEFARLLGWGA